MKAKKAFVLFLVVLMVFAVISGCSKVDSNSISINTDASIGGFEWGVTKNDISTKAEKLGLTVSESERFITLNDVQMFDTTATINFSFISFKKADYPTLADDTPLLLIGANIVVHSASKENIAVAISKILGSQETKQLVFYDEAGNFGYKYDGELDESKYYWHSATNLIESIGLEKLGEIYPALTAKELTRNLYNSYDYIVSISDSTDIVGLEDGAVLISISADAVVAKSIYLG